MKVAFKKIVEGHMDRKQCEHWFWFSRVQSSGLWGAKYSPLTSIILLYQEECVLKNVPISGIGAAAIVLNTVTEVLGGSEKQAA